ncbi:MAG TPA: hypothetical protein PLJ62_04520 [Thermoflexales bacterium]|nr:hypothetical protein [Thermoflexales bacterium]HQW35863.1 hypothetical protein [Thermoflexales bacterium]HQZ23012.1 hypothetical protein [Thermoflexales bacterium]HQZ99441.1 hypothetical protein [Thermoflexales bacterium]
MFKRMAGALALALALPMFGAACGAKAPLSEVKLSPGSISPNADGVDDVARFSYRVSQPVNISIYLTDAAGKRYDLRANEARTPSPQPYEFLFSGVSGGKLLPDGDYIWHVQANTAETASGKLQIKDGQKTFPKIQDFTTDTTVITPNRDGINDRMAINVYLTQKARLDVYVMGANGFRYDVPRKEGDLLIQPTGDELAAGRYNYDYDGGIDLGADPPPDGAYTLVAEAQDRIGQRDLLTKSITIKEGGRPAAEIVIQPNGSGVEWSGIKFQPFQTLPLGGAVYFTMTVRNSGLVPIRTAGPFMDTPQGNECYTMDQNRYTKGFIEEPGVWRVGVDWETNTGTDHPWRWGLGSLADLDQVKSPNGDTLYYLAPGKQVLVRGCVILNKMQPRNPFTVWASLIQEQVEIAAINNRVTPFSAQLIKP